MSATAPEPGAHRGRPPLLLIFALTVTGITGNTLVFPAIPEILDGLGAPARLAGVVLGAATLPGIALAPVIGVLADRYGRRAVLLPCLVLFGVAGGLGAAATSLWWLVILRFVQGAGSAGLVNLAVVLIGDHWGGAERARIIGRNAAVLTVGLAMMPLLGGLLTDLGGWQAPFLVYPLALVTAGAVVRNLPRSQPRDVRVGQQLADALPALRRREVATMLGLSTVTFALIFGLLLTVLPVYLEAGFGVSASLRGVLLGLPALANTAVALSLGRLQRFTKRGQLLTASSLFVVALTIVATSGTLPGIVAGIVCFGAGEGLMIPNLQDIATGASAAATRGTVVALFVACARLGQTVGPLLAGAALGTLSAQGTFATGAALAVVLLVPLVLIGRRHDRLPAAH